MVTVVCWECSACGWRWFPEAATEGRAPQQCPRRACRARLHLEGESPAKAGRPPAFPTLHPRPTPAPRAHAPGCPCPQCRPPAPGSTARPPASRPPGVRQGVPPGTHPRARG